MPPASGQVAVGIDVGGTTYAACLIDADGDLIADVSYPTPEVGSAEALLAAFAETARELIAEAAGYEPVGLGIGVPGTVSPDEREVRDCPNLTILNGIRVPEFFEQRMDMPVWMQNDAYCATLAELRYGAGRDHANVLLLTLGTGVGGGIALNNEVFHGPRQVMGEIGHVILDLNGPPCSCGTMGCAEAFVGKQAIIDRALCKLAAYPNSALAQYAAADPAAVTPKLIADLARQGDEMCLGVMSDIGLYIGQTLCNAIVLCDPDIILLGGGIAGAGDVLFDPIRRTVKERTPISGFDPSNILPCELGNKAGTVGAAALVWERLKAEQ